MTPNVHSGSGAMFDTIAGRYDLLNRLMSLGLDQSWRRRLVASIAPALTGVQSRVLDLATGTADVAIAIAQQFQAAHVVGLDPSTRMLDLGREKIKGAGLCERIALETGDAQCLEHPNLSFDAVCISFGIRNIPNRLEALREMTRVTKRGGRIGILELAEPRTGWLAPFARFHVHRFVPWVGGMLSQGDQYRYLQTSIAAFPTADEFCSLMRSAGLGHIAHTSLCLGAVHLFTATAP